MQHDTGEVGDVGDDAPVPDASGRRPVASVVVPAPEVWATVTFAELPSTPPDDLVPYTVRTTGARDWVLTDDVLAFGESHVVERFTQWRASWERTWELEPISNVLRLFDLARHLDPEADASGGPLERTLAQHRRDDGDVEIPPADLDRCRAELERLADVVRARGAVGYGVVDLTPGTRRVGLARAWPGWGADEVVAADDGVEVVLRPATGLHLHVSSQTLPEATVGPIEHAVYQDDRWTIAGQAGSVSVDRSRARPLAWLVPGATAWRVRQIPEVLAWAKFFSALDDCLGDAVAAHLPVRLTTRRPIAEISATDSST